MGSRTAGRRRAGFPAAWVLRRGQRAPSFLHCSFWPTLADVQPRESLKGLAGMGPGNKEVFLSQIRVWRWGGGLTQFVATAKAVCLVFGSLANCWHNTLRTIVPPGSRSICHVANSHSQICNFKEKPSLQNIFIPDMGLSSSRNALAVSVFPSLFYHCILKALSFLSKYFFCSLNSFKYVVLRLFFFSFDWPHLPTVASLVFPQGINIHWDRDDGQQVKMAAARPHHKGRCIHPAFASRHFDFGGLSCFHASWSAKTWRPSQDLIKYKRACRVLERWLSQDQPHVLLPLNP